MKSMTLTLLAIAPLLGACATSTSNEVEAPSDATAEAAVPGVNDLEAMGVRNISLANEGVLCAGQLTPAQMDALHAGGYRTFVSLRLPDENGTGWEEAHAEAAGIRFERLPIAGAAGIGETSARALADLLGDGSQPAVVYCGSSNRVGALMGLKAYHVDGVSAADALELGKASGLKKLEPVFRTQVGL